MTYPHGRAKVDSSSPRAFAICDRCGFLYNHSNLNWQFDYRGRTLANLRILVCDTCNDEPQPQLKPRIIPPDPVPIMNPRTERYEEYEQNTRYTSGQNTVDFWTGIPVVQGDVRITQSGETRVTQQTGEPPGGRSFQPGQVFMLVPNDDEIGLPYDNTEVPRVNALPPDIQQADWDNSGNDSVEWMNNLEQNVNWDVKE